MTNKPPFDGSLNMTKRPAAFARSEVRLKVMDARQTRLKNKILKDNRHRGSIIFYVSKLILSRLCHS